MSPQRTKTTFLTGALAAMAILATGGMAMGPPLEPVRMSSMNAEKTAGYAVFDRYGEKVGRIESVQNVNGRTMWLNVALDEGGTARVASFRGFLDAPKKEIALVLTQDLISQRAVDQANAAADAAAFKAVMEENGEGEEIASLPKSST
jgi:hypothetical protein